MSGHALGTITVHDIRCNASNSHRCFVISLAARTVAVVGNFIETHTGRVESLKSKHIKTL